MNYIEILPKATNIINTAKFFGWDKDVRGVMCFTEQGPRGWNGYSIALKYLHEVGYYYDISPFSISFESLEWMFNKDYATADINKGVLWLGECDNCVSKLFDIFTNKFHDVNKCGKKKAVAISTEVA